MPEQGAAQSQRLSSALPAHYLTKKTPKLLPMIEVGRDFSDFLGDSVPVDVWRARRESQIAGKDAER